MSRQRSAGHIPGLTDLIQIPDRYTAPGEAIEAACNALLPTTQGIQIIGELLDAAAAAPRPLNKDLLTSTGQLLNFLCELQTILHGVIEAAAVDMGRAMAGEKKRGAA